MNNGMSSPVPKDIDIEVFGVPLDKLTSVLARWGRVDEVGKSFAVIKLTTIDGTFDFALPRRDKKTGLGNHGFSVEPDPYIDPKIASVRRDFTMNTISYNLKQGEFVDLNNGIADMERGILRHTSPAFLEDPIRPLRGFQFCGRFNLTAAQETLDISRVAMAEYHAESIEKIATEWRKWASMSVAPEKGIEFLEGSGWIDLYPSIKNMEKIKQDQVHHPEIFVGIHTKACLTHLANNPKWKSLDEETRATLMFSVLCHDFAKPQCTVIKTEDGHEKITSYGHEKAGGPMAKKFLEDIGQTQSIISKVVPLVETHLAYIDSPTPRSVRRLAIRLAPATIEEAGLLWHADNGGRPPLPPNLPETAKQLLEIASQVNVSLAPPVPLVKGRDLISKGFKPGKEMGVILGRAYEAQIEGLFSNKEEGLEFLGIQAEKSKTLQAPTPQIQNQKRKENGLCGL